MERGKKIYEGKAKILYATAREDQLVQYFKDDATAFNAKKKGTIVEKGKLNCAISARIFGILEEAGVKTHFIRTLGEREMLVKRCAIIPVEVVVRNTVAGSLAKRLGLKEGEKIPETLLEWYYKSDSLGDPMINKEHIRIFGFATAEEMSAIERTVRRVNTLLVPWFETRGIRLVDYKLEFGRHAEGLLLADEITPDGCRLWDLQTGEKMDKDRFRYDLGEVEEKYREVHRRVFS